VAADSLRRASSANLPSGSASAAPVTIVPWILPLRQFGRVSRASGGGGLLRGPPGVA
jgi:hypothetical protein